MMTSEPLTPAELQTAFDSTLQAAIDGEYITDTGLPEQVVDALFHLADQWPDATAEQIAAVRTMFALTLPT